mmetsp:Transcript_36549/g.57076  ORF Transcript_36549/g.57076 Transcript_36549/m.57076 type:complete len:90 (-) Transcript_36549:1190-1459(-)
MNQVLAEIKGPQEEGKEYSVAEEMEINNKERELLQMQETLERNQKEYEALAGKVEEQPPNTTKLGFTISKKIGMGEHCEWHKCQRALFY